MKQSQFSLRCFVWALLLLVPLFGNAQQAVIGGRVKLDSGWARKFYVCRISGFDLMFTASDALIIAEGNIDGSGNFYTSFPCTKQQALYRLHFVRKGDPASTLIIGGPNANHVFFIARQSDHIDVEKNSDEPLSQADIKADPVNKELKTVIRVKINDTTSNNTLITLAGRSSSQLVGLLAIYRTSGLNEQQKPKIRNILARYDPHNSYGAHIFREYGQADDRRFYLAGSCLLLAAVLFFGYHFYRRRSAFRIWRGLTQREQDIIKLILARKTNKEIAVSLSIEISTVKTHVNNIYAKLKVSNRQDLDKYKRVLKRVLVPSHQR